MLRILTVILCTTALTGADDPPKPAVSQAATPAPPTPPEFKILWASFGVGEDPLAVYQMLTSRGKVYEFRGNSAEVVVFDPSQKLIYVVDFKLRSKARITYREVDDRIATLRREAIEAADELERKTGRADRVAGTLKRIVVEPKFQANFDEGEHRLKLTNASIEIEARGEHEDDPARFAVLSEYLMEAVKLRTIRDPSDLRQFTEIETLSDLIEKHKLRPMEITFLFRLAGKPQKLRAIYRVVPEIPADERKNIAAVDALLNSPIQAMTLDRFDRLIDPDDLKK
jgi:hypothetical protein